MLKQQHFYFFPNLLFFLKLPSRLITWNKCDDHHFCQMLNWTVYPEAYSIVSGFKCYSLSWSLHDRRNIGKKIHDMRPEKKYQTWNSFCWLLSGGHTANTVLLVEKTKLQLCWKHQHFNFCSNKDRVLKYYFIWLNFFGIGSSRGGGKKKQWIFDFFSPKH